MKKVSTIILALIMAFQLNAPAFASVFYIDEKEPNNSTETAQLINVTTGYIKGSVEAGNDDVFHFAIGKKSSIQITIFPRIETAEDQIDAYVLELNGNRAFDFEFRALNDKDGNFLTNMYTASLSADGDFCIALSLKDGANEYGYSCYFDITPVGIENFKKQNEYAANYFSDVPVTAWFAESVKTAYELGLVNGNNGQYNPTGNLTYAETLALACRMHSIYNGMGGEFDQGSPWYQVYVDYAKWYNIFSSNDESIYAKPITRAEFANIMYNAMSASLESINELSETPPDVDTSTPNWPAILTLYRAGVLAGSDKYGTFHPNNNIQRSEVATIISRLAIPELRLHFTLEKKPLEVKSVYIKESAHVIVVGKTLELEAVIEPSDVADKTITWESSNPEVATVSAKGVVVGKNQGATEITATAVNGKKTTYSIIVVTQEIYDAAIAKTAYDVLYDSLKFPDTLRINNLWVFDEGQLRSIEFDYSAANNVGVMIRSFCKVSFFGEKPLLKESSNSPMHTASNARNVRKLDISILFK